MKIKSKLIVLIQVMLIAGGVGYSNISSAAACTANTSPGSTSCTELQINSPTGTIEISGTVSTLPPPSNNPAVDLTSSGSVQSMNIAVTGSVVSLSNDAIRNIGGVISSLTNSGNISGRGVTSYGISNLSGGVISSINNAGVISGARGINVGGASTIGSIVNSGSIYGASSYAISNVGVTATINTITNTATIGSASSGIFGTGGIDIVNTGTIGTINNAQSNTSLVLGGNLPSNYNIIINSPMSYGRFTATSVGGGGAPSGGPMAFGIYAGSQVIVSSYASVLNNLSSTNLGGSAGLTGKYQGMTWTLTDPLNNSLWDLTFSGTNTAVMSALNQTTTALQNAFTLQNTVLVNGFTYDCSVFDKNNVCVSVGARGTSVNTESVNSTGGLLIGAYRINNQIRAGAYIDQNISTNSTGIVKVANASPMVGVFGVWNERLDGTGTEVKVSAGYGQKNTTMTRPVVDGTEAGSGSSALTSQGVQAIGKYGFAVADKTLVSPYVGLRYTQNNMGGYTEGSSATVTAPLTYSAVNTNATTVVAGLGANYKVMSDVTLLASAGLENDLNTSNGTYSATGLYGINSINFNSNPVRTRATASAGAYYDLAKNQRVSLSYIFRQEQFQGVNTNAAFLTYAVGL